MANRTQKDDYSRGGSSLAESRSFDSYCKDCRCNKIMTDAEEVAAFKRLRAGDETAKDEIFAHNRGYVINQAHKFNGSKLTFEDLVQEGNIGMLRAIDKFDETRGIRFVLYARWWIRQAFQCSSATSGYPVSLPRRNWTSCQNALRAENDIFASITSRPTVEQIMEKSGEPESVVRSAMVMRYGHIKENVDDSGEEIDGDKMTRGDLFTRPDQYANMEDIDNRAIVEKVLSRVSDKERFSIIKRFGLDGGDAMTLDAIGLLDGVSREAIRLRIENGLEKIRASKELREYMDVLL